MAPPVGYDAYPYAPVGGLPAPPVTGELLPRQQRRRQQAWRGVAVFVVALALLAALGWVFRDVLLPGGPEPGATATTVAGGPPPAVAASPQAAGTPTARPAVANLLATATPTVAPAPQPSPPPTATPSPPPAAAAADTGGEADPALTSLVDLLPADDLLPEGFAATTTEERSVQEVAESLGGGDEQAQQEAAVLLDDWGWDGNAARSFQGQTANGSYAINVSIHRFADGASADDALVYFTDRIVAVGYAQAEVEPIGDGATLVLATGEGDPTSVVYARDGRVMYRVGATAAAGGDPTPDVIALAQTLVGR